MAHVYGRSNLWQQPLFAFVEVAKPEPEKNQEGAQKSKEMSSHPLVSLLDDGILEYAKQLSLKDGHQRRKFHRTIHRHPIDPVSTLIETTPEKFLVRIPLGKDANPEDVSLTIKDRNLLIHIKLQKTSEDGTSSLDQIFTKKVALPEEVDVKGVKSHLTPEGILAIEAPFPVQESPKEPESVKIPVQVHQEVSEEPNEPQKVSSNPDIDIEFPAEASE